MAHPQENSILESIHQVIVNILRTFNFQKNYLDEENYWSGILADMDFAYYYIRQM